MERAQIEKIVRTDLTALYVVTGFSEHAPGEAFEEIVRTVVDDIEAGRIQLDGDRLPIKLLGARHIGPRPKEN